MLEQAEKKTAALRIAVTEREKEEITAIAKQENRTVSNLVRVAINFYLENKSK